MDPIPVEVRVHSRSAHVRGAGRSTQQVFFFLLLAIFPIFNVICLLLRRDKIVSICVCFSLMIFVAFVFQPRSDIFVFIYAFVGILMTVISSIFLSYHGSF